MAMSSMVGREYIWRGRRWRVICRWRHVPHPERTSLCPGCGQILNAAGCSLVSPATECGCVPMPDTQFVGGVVRNVLIEDCETGRRTVRPFGGLRKPKDAPLPARPISALGWDLRGALASRRKTRLVLTDRCDGVLRNAEGQRILEGTVTSVSPTDAFTVLAGRHIPISEIEAIVKPHHSQAAPSDPTDPQEAVSARRTS